jgi:aspartate/methionine/tyrosine aminotransferase
MFAQRTGWDLATNPLTQALQRRVSSGAELLDLTQSNPTRCGLTYPAENILSALSDPASLIYDPQPLGLPSARHAVRDHYASLSHPAELSTEQLVLTTSTSEGYSFLFRLLCNPGDRVLVPRPSYPLFEFLAGIQDVELAPYSLLYDHGWQIDFHSLEQAVDHRTRAILLVHPNNPTGSYVSSEERERLNQICRRHQLALIADEVFLDYSWADKPVASFAGNEQVLTFTLSGLSKSAGLPQMKLAWMVVTGPERQRKDAMQRLEVISDTYLSLSAPQQHALPSLLQSRGAFQAQLRQRLMANLTELDSALGAQSACNRLLSQGGWYAILRVPVLGSDDEMTVGLLEKSSVLVHPGHFFDFEEEGYIILSLMTEERTFREGVRRILTYFR